MILYTCYLVKNPEELERKFPPVHPNKFYHHCTIEFGKNSAPVNDGEEFHLKIIGRLTNDKVDCLVVDPSSYNGNNPIPHITLSTASGIKPAASNMELQKDSFEHITPFSVTTVLTTVTN